MDETRTEQTPTHTTIEHTHDRPSGSGSSAMWFLIGGVVVVVAIVAYLVMGDGGLISDSASQPTGGNVSVNVESNDAPAVSEPAATAPAETAPAEAAPTPAPTEAAPQAD
jgi:hypothetical protein